MNENINLVEILKDCPSGTKLYTPLCGEVEFCAIVDDEVWSIRERFHNNGSPVTLGFMKDGRYHSYPNAECLLLPSKDQRDWSKFKAPWLKKPKFDPKTLQPFDRVLVRDHDHELWKCTLFSHRTAEYYSFVCCDTSFEYCIPYNEDTKHLVGTTEEAPEYYRYWED